MGLKQDLPLIAGLILVLGGVVYAGGTSGLPGIGDLDNPLNEWVSDTSGDKDVNYDLTAQVNIGFHALGEGYMQGFTYQTQKSCTFCLSIGTGDNLALTGANNVRVETTLTNTDTGKVYVQNTKSFGEVSGTEGRTVHISADNLPPGQYEIRYRMSYDPQVVDYANPDGEFTETYSITVPKVEN
jgi:hypothetical protein